MNQFEFIEKLKFIESETKTLYVMGCFGAPLNTTNKKRYTQNHDYNKQASRTALINSASYKTYGWDCVNLIKGVIWGWNNDLNKTYGGAVYKSNGCPDISANQMISVCKNISSDFNNIQVGEAVWMEGHIGVYIGNGQVIESSPKWKNGVQITYLGNLGYTEGNSRIWKKHGFIPYIDYVETEGFVENGYLKGNGKEDYGLNEDMLRILTILYRVIKDRM